MDEKDIAHVKVLVEELITWLKSFDCDVDHDAFDEACRDILAAAFHGRRIPPLRGAIALDVACCMARIWTPVVVINSRLPGACELRALLDVEYSTLDCERNFHR